MTWDGDEESEIILYDHPLSPYAQKVKIALLEKGIPFRALRPDGIGSGVAGGGFSDASPRGEVPALVQEPDVRLFDSTIILEYIEDRWPEPPLRSSNPLEQARQREIEDVMDSHFEAITWGLSEIRYSLMVTLLSSSGPGGGPPPGCSGTTGSRGSRSR